MQVDTFPSSRLEIISSAAGCPLKSKQVCLQQAPRAFVPRMLSITAVSEFMEIMATVYSALCLCDFRSPLWLGKFALQYCAYLAPTPNCMIILCLEVQTFSFVQPGILTGMPRSPQPSTFT